MTKQHISRSQQTFSTSTSNYCTGIHNTTGLQSYADREVTWHDIGNTLSGNYQMNAYCMA